MIEDGTLRMKATTSDTLTVFARVLTTASCISHVGFQTQEPNPRFVRYTQSPSQHDDVPVDKRNRIYCTNAEANVMIHLESDHR